MDDLVFHSGRYAGRPLAEVAIEDPEYYIDAHESGMIESHSALYDIALSIMPTEIDGFGGEEEYLETEPFDYDIDHEDGC